MKQKLDKEEISIPLHSHGVRTGLRGEWDFDGRSDIDTTQAVTKGLFHIENWSLSLDPYTLLKPPGAVLSRRGAH